MKLTVNVDDQLFQEVMEMTGARNENELFQVALQHISAQHYMRDFLGMGPPPTPEELGNAYAPDYDPDAAYTRPSLAAR